MEVALRKMFNSVSLVVVFFFSIIVSLIVSFTEEVKWILSCLLIVFFQAVSTNLYTADLQQRFQKLKHKLKKN